MWSFPFISSTRDPGPYPQTHMLWLFVVRECLVIKKAVALWRCFKPSPHATMKGDQELQGSSQARCRCTACHWSRLSLEVSITTRKKPSLCLTSSSSSWSPCCECLSGAHIWAGSLSGGRGPLRFTCTTDISHFPKANYYYRCSTLSSPRCLSPRNWRQLPHNQL